MYFSKLRSFIFPVLFGIFGFWLGTNFSDRYQSEYVTPSLSSTTDSGESDSQSCSGRFRKFCEIDAILTQEGAYDTGMDLTGMIEQSLHGYVEGLRDPYTEYFNPEENKIFMGDLQGDRKFEGIGAVVGKKGAGIVIQEIIKGSPAYQAGLKPQDIVVMIDDKPTKGLSIFESINYIRGTGGTEVKLTIMRSSENRVFEVSIKRGKVNIPSVTSQIYQTGTIKIGHITISILGEDTKAAFASLANDLRYNQHIQGLILDLRGNGGGILDSAVDVASHFVSKDQDIVGTAFRSLSGQVYRSKGYRTLQDIPVIVLIDELSASAAEVLALALQYHSQAQLIGQKSFGKGSIQTMTFLEDNSSIKYTIGKWFGPGGQSINHSGIVPDYHIILDQTGFIYSGVDSQLAFAQDLLRARFFTGMINQTGGELTGFVSLDLEPEMSIGSDH